MPVLERPYEKTMLLAPPDKLTKTRDPIDETVAAAVAANETLPEVSPTRTPVLFNRFGQTLRDDEGIEMRQGISLSGPPCRRAIRRALVLHHKTTYQDDISGIGWNSEIDAMHMRCFV